MDSEFLAPLPYDSRFMGWAVAIMARMGASAFSRFTSSMKRFKSSFLAFSDTMATSFPFKAIKPKIVFDLRFARPSS